METLAAPIDIVVGGVPKSGTTSLFHALSVHPQIQVPIHKETYYFNDSITVPWTEGTSFREHGWEGFEKFFPEPREARLRLEASAVTIYQKTALDLFTSMATPPFLIVALRCPAAQIRSNFYFHLSYGRIEPGVKFADYVTALMAEDETVLAKMVPGSVLRSQLAPSMRWNRYVEWLDLWKERLPADRMAVVTFTEVVEEPVRVLQSICHQVGIDPSIYEGYHAPHLNATSAGQVRPPGLLARVGRRLPPGPQRDRLAAWYRNRRSGPKLGPPSPSDEVALDILGNEFHQYNRALAERYGIDISDWRPPTDRG